MKLIRAVDPQGVDAVHLLREAAIEARDWYGDRQSGEATWPTNSPTPERGTYLVGYASELTVALGALRPLAGSVAEVRRMYGSKSHRRQGWAREVLGAVEGAGAKLKFEVPRLETGNRQLAATALYSAYDFKQIQPYGEYVNDPRACYEKRITTLSAA